MRALVYLDLDGFGEAVEKKGWDSYSPNPVTRALTGMVEELRETHSASILCGLDRERGTEEALVFFADIAQDRLEEELEEMRAGIEELGRRLGTGTTLSIGVALDIPEATLKPMRREEIKKNPVTRLAHDALRKAKKEGNCVFFG